MCYRAVSAFLIARKLYLRYLALPRPEFRRQKFLAEKPDPNTGRYHFLKKSTDTWYMKPSLSKRWGPRALRKRLLGGLLPGDDGDKYRPGGYLISELGPENLEESGRASMAETVKTLEKQDRGGCPFEFS